MGGVVAGVATSAGADGLGTTAVTGMIARSAVFIIPTETLQPVSCLDDHVVAEKRVPG